MPNNRSSKKNPLDQAIEQVTEELAGRQTLDICDPLFPKQTALIRHRAKLRSLWCTRRAAKSYTGGLGLVQAALEQPECNTLYIGLTRASAKGVIWKDILKCIDRRHNLGMSFNGSELTATLPNGSIIYATGIDASEDEMHKLLGKKWKRVVIDEAQSYSIDLRALVYGVLKPATVDYGGDIWLLGTSGNLTAGLFYDITLGNEPGWERFEWTAHDNPYVAKQWQEELDDIAQNRPLFMQTSLFKQWYLNQWTIDEDAKVYSYIKGFNSITSLPAVVDPYHYVLGLDLAHSPDSTAFVVGCYHELDPTLYLVYAYKQVGMDITSVAEFTKKLEKQYAFEVKVVDGANKQAVAELNNRHGLNLIPADKTGKSDFITLMNDDFVQANIKLLSAADPLATEYEKLIWLTDANGKVMEPKKENPLIHNDLSDSALYLWRHCYQFLFKPAVPLKDMTRQENWEPAHLAKLQEQARKEQNPNELDLDWTESWDSQDEDLI